MQESKVLIIDEESEFAAILTDRLCSWGFAVLSAGNREEAMESIVLSRPDVVVLSLRAGHIYDLETLSVIKDMDPGIEVILLTGKGTALVGMQGIERGAFDCLPQPIELGLLIEKIRQACAQRSLPRPVGSGMPLLLPILSGDDGSELLASLFVWLKSLCDGLSLLSC